MHFIFASLLSLMLSVNAGAGAEASICYPAGACAPALSRDNPSGVCHRRSGCLADEGDYRSSLDSCFGSAFMTDGGACISL